MYFVYILLCADNTLYTGITKDLKRRFQEHQEGIGSKYTRARKAVKIVYSKKCRNKSFALKHEAKIKRLTRDEKNKLIKK